MGVSDLPLMLTAHAQGQRRECGLNSMAQVAQVAQVRIAKTTEMEVMEQSTMRLARVICL